MKKIVSALTAIAMLLAFSTVPVSAIPHLTEGDAVSFTLDTVEAEPDSDVSVSLRLEGNYSATALTVFVEYPTDMLTNKGSLKKGEVWYDIVDAEGMVQQNINNPGRIGFMAIVPDGAFSAEGTVFTIEFHVSADAAPGTEIMLSLTVSQFTYDELSGNVIHIPFTAQDGKITIPASPAVTATPEPTETPEPISTPEPTPELDTVAFAVETVHADPDSEVSLALSLSGSYSATALTVFLEYDPALLVISGELEHGAVWSAINDVNGMVQTNTAASGRIGFMAIVPEGDFGAEGILFTMRFQVSAEAEYGSTIPVTLSVSQFTYDELSGNVVHIPFTAESGAVVINDEPIVTPTPEPIPVDIRITEAEAEPGEEVSVSLEMTGEYSATALTVFVDYDPALLTLTGDLEPGAVWQDINGKEGLIQQNTGTPGRIGFMAIVAEGDFNTEGTVFTMHFTVSSEAQPGTVIPLALTVSQFTYDHIDGTVEAILYTAENGHIIVTEPRPTVTFIDGLTGEIIAVVKVDEGADAIPPIPPEHTYYIFRRWDGDYTSVTANVTVTAVYVPLGDADLSDVTQLADATELVAYLLNIRPLSDEALFRADANRDSTVDILDVAAICAIALNQ